MRRFAGEPLKPASFSFGNETIRGEAIITRDGIEGGAIYALSSRLRDAVDREGHADLAIDLFAQESPVGQTIVIGDWPFLVVASTRRSLERPLGEVTQPGRASARLSPLALAHWASIPTTSA